MSILPEMIIQQTLIRGIRAFREDTRLIDMLFRNVDQDTLQLIRSFLRDNSIEICLNYPDQDLKVPSIVILLKNEAESQPFLGDLQQGADRIDQELLGISYPADELIGDQTVIGSGSTSPLSYITPLLLQPTRAIGGTTNTIVAPAGTIHLIDPFETESWVVVMEGTSAGDKLKVESITPSFRPGQGVTIEVEGTFRAIPDTTTIFKIVGPVDNEGVTGIASKIYTSEDKIERFGSIFKANYQLDIHGPDQESTIYLYILVKAIFFTYNHFMIKQGFLTFIRMSGTDMAPAVDYYPLMVYRRSLSLEFEYSFDVFKAIAEPLAKHLQLNLAVHEPDVSKVEDVERTVSTTEFDIT
jgi:hypothetical protein